MLPICNDQKVALDDFKAMFCDRCLQPECTRSSTGGDRFEKRVANWHQNLFVAPPRMDPQDPRYAVLSAQKFLTIDTGPIPEVGRSSAWVDPRDLSDAPPTRGPAPVTQPDPALMTPIARKAPEPLPKTTAAGQPMNTPNAGPRMLGNAPMPAQIPQKDAWAGPMPSKSSETLVAPGAKVRTRGPGTSGV